jgi:hypothetical protein
MDRSRPSKSQLVKKRSFNLLKSCTQASTFSDDMDTAIQHADDVTMTRRAAALVESGSIYDEQTRREIHVKQRHRISDDKSLTELLQEANSHLDALKGDFRQKYGTEDYMSKKEELSEKEAEIDKQYKILKDLGSTEDRDAIDKQKTVLLQAIELLAREYKRALKIS